MGSKGHMGEKKIGECAQKYACKQKPKEEKITCWSERLSCNRGKHQMRFDKLKSKVGKKNFAKKKQKRLGKLSERITKLENKISEKKQKLVKKQTAKKPTDFINARIKVLEERLNMLNDYKSQTEALN